MARRKSPISLKSIIGKNILTGITIKPIRVPRGPTVRWSVNYDKLFKRRKK